MRPSPSRDRAWLAIVLLLAIALRAFHLGRYSLWLDEAATWWNATRAGWLATAFAEPNHPPVWWLATRASIVLFGDSEAAVRLPAAISGCLAVGLAALLARRLFRNECSNGLVTLFALLVACNGFLIEYAQEARMYSLLLAESLGLSLLLFDWLDRRRVRSLVAYGALAILSEMTHFFAVWPLAGHALFVLILAMTRRSEVPVKRAAAFWGTQAVALAALVAWLAAVVRASPGVSSGGRFDALERLVYSLWRIGVGPALAAVDRPRVDAGLSAFAREEWVTLLVTALLWGIPLLVGTIRLRRHREAAAFLGCGILVPIAGLLAIQSRLPLMHEKYLIALAPLLLAVAAFGAWTAPRALRPALIAGLLVLSGAGLAAYHLPGVPLVRTLLVRGHPYGHEQWRELHASIESEGRPGVPIALAHAYLDRAWRYYDRAGHPLLGLPEIGATRAERDQAIVRAVRAGAYFVLAHDRDVDRSADLATIARATGIPSPELESRVVLWPRSWGIRELAPSWPPGEPGPMPEPAADR